MSIGCCVTSASSKAGSSSVVISGTVLSFDATSVGGSSAREMTDDPKPSHEAMPLPFAFDAVLAGAG